MTTQTNYFINTIADFKRTQKPSKTPDFISYSGIKKFLTYEKINEGEYDGLIWIDVKNKEESPHLRDFHLYDKKDITGGSYAPQDDFIDFHILEWKQEGVLIKLLEEISSEYIYTEEGVFRTSTHWGTVSSCIWTLNSKNIEGDTNNKILTGFCSWDDFKQLNLK